jgi:hypothetical protein
LVNVKLAVNGIGINVVCAVDTHITVPPTLNDEVNVNTVCDVMLLAVVFKLFLFRIVTEGLLVHCVVVVPFNIMGVVKFDGGGT